MEPREYQMCARYRTEGKRVSTGIKRLASILGKRIHITHVRRLAFTKSNDILPRERCVCFEEYAKQW